MYFIVIRQMSVLHYYQQQMCLYLIISVNTSAYTVLFVLTSVGCAPPAWTSIWRNRQLFNRINNNNAI